MRKNSIQAAHEIFIKALDSGQHGKAAEELSLKEQVSRVPADRGVSYHF